MHALLQYPAAAGGGGGEGGGGGGVGDERGIRLKVGFQSLMVISPTASGIQWSIQVYAGVGVVS